jgi:glyoxylase-like metal-dependent hydrolase (beta-lactamase superfamily II)
VTDGAELPAAGGIRAVHTPGHTTGHVSYLWPDGGVLFVGDAATNMFRRLNVAPINEDDAAARASFAKLAELDFRVACFGHGSPIRGRAVDRFRRRLEKVARTSP